MASSYSVLCSKVLARPISLFVDFDGTITVDDTLSILAHAGYKDRAGVRNSPPPRRWSEIVEAYLKDLKAHEDKYDQKPHNRHRIEDEIQWLNSLQPIEDASAHRAIAEHIFDDVTEGDLDRCVAEAVDNGELSLRPGWHDLIAAVTRHNQKVTTSSDKPFVNILSVNWSRTLIDSTIRKTLPTLNNAFIPEKIGIYANELPSVAQNIQSSNIYGGETVALRTSGDKAYLMKKLIAEHVQASCEDIPPLTVYFGDSSTDLECLLEADLGICVRDDPMTSGQRELQTTCKRLGIGVAELAQLTRKRDLKDDKLSLWHAKTFKDVVEVLEN